MGMAALAEFLLFLITCSSLCHAAPANSGDAGGLNIKNITAIIGQQVEIPCSLKASADSVKLVWTNWDRQVILTVNHISVTRDERITSNEKDGSWSLSIENVQRKDAGIYRCQINTSPGLTSDVNLQVVSGRCDEKNEFACAEDRCIPRLHRCDGLNHCVDGEDEENCTPEDCKGVNIYCGNGKCIPLQYFCDENDDCGNGFDEANCSRPLPVDCPAGEFPCGDGECVPLRKHCDGRRDCENGADEHPDSCHPSQGNTNVTIRGTACDASTSSCGGGICVPTSWWCDGEVDCDSAADEKACTARDCQPETTYCGNGRCSKGGRCDGKNDCLDNLGYDEANCSASDCFPGARYCGNGRCAASYMICDGIDQCGNGADEKFCEPLPQQSTTVESVATPAPGDIKGRVAEDEDLPFIRIERLVASIARASNESLALQRVIAASAWRSCKHQYDTTMLEHVGRGYFPCAEPWESGPTVSLNKRCDGIRDCTSGRDEDGCSLHEVCGPNPTRA